MEFISIKGTFKITRKTVKVNCSFSMVIFFKEISLTIQLKEKEKLFSQTETNLMALFITPVMMGKESIFLKMGQSSRDFIKLAIVMEKEFFIFTLANFENLPG